MATIAGAAPAAERGRWLAERWPRWVTAAAVTWAAGWLLAMWLAPDKAIQGRFEDAGTYYLAGRAFLHGQSYYATPDFREWPLVAALWSPVALLPPAVALRGWMLLILAAIAGAVALLVREYGPAGRPGGRWLLFAVAGPPVLFMLYLGQMSGLCFAAYAAGLACLRRRPALAGGCFALMAAKPHLVLLALPALTTAAWPALLAFGGVLLLWPAGSLLVGGPAVFRTFLLQIYTVRDTTIGLVASSLSSLFPLRGGLHEVVQFALLALLLVGAGWLALRRLRHGRTLAPAAIDVAAALALMALPYALVSDLLFLLPALLRLGEHPDRRAWLLLAAWWAIPWAATLLTHHGWGGLAALLPPLVVLAGWQRWVRPAPRDAAYAGGSSASR